MEWVWYILGPVLLIIWWNVSAYRKYKGKERKIKQEIVQSIQEGVTIQVAILKHFSALNRKYEIGLSEETLFFLSTSMGALAASMDLENIIEIYATFLDRYIYRDSKQDPPVGVSNKQVRLALESLEFQERNGYFVLKPDSPSNMSKVYPARIR